MNKIDVHLFILHAFDLGITNHMHVFLVYKHPDFNVFVDYHCTNVQCVSSYLHQKTSFFLNIIFIQYFVDVMSV